MVDFNITDITDVQSDVLKEIGNIGAGNAATALSKLVKQRVDMTVPVVSLCGFNELTEIVGGPENVMVGILIGIQGDVNGMMMFLLEKKSASQLIEAIMNIKRDNIDTFDEIEISAIGEIGNIISGAYLTALSSFTNMNISATVPVLSIDMVAALLNVPATEYGQIGDQVLFIQTHFGQGDFMRGYFLLIPDVESYGKILKSLGV